MCGLAGYIGNSPNIDKLRILALYNKTRGTDGFGIAVNDTRFVFIGREGDSKEYLESNYFPVEEITSNIVLMHTRQASVGLKTVDNTHPFEYRTADNKLLGFFSMNGTVSNYNEMLKTRGITATFTNDSNALGFMMFHDLFEPNIMKEYIGGGAFAFYSVSERKLRLWKGAAGNIEERPLYYMITDKGIYYSSLRDSLLFIRENKQHEIVIVPNNTLLVFNETSLESSVKIDRPGTLANRNTGYHQPSVHRNTGTTTTTTKIRSINDILINELYIIGEKSNYEIVKVLDRYYYRCDIAHGVAFKDSQGRLLTFKHSEILKETTTNTNFNVTSNYEYFRTGFSVSEYCKTLFSLVASKGAKIEDIQIYIYGVRFNTIDSFKAFMSKLTEVNQFDSFMTEGSTSKVSQYFTGFYIQSYLIKRGFTGEIYNTASVTIQNNDKSITSMSPRTIGNIIVDTNKVNSDFRISIITNINNLPLAKTVPLKLNLNFISQPESTSFDVIGSDLQKVESIVKAVKNKLTSKNRKEFIENVTNQIIRKFTVVKNILERKGEFNHPSFKNVVPLKTVSYMNSSGTKSITGTKSDDEKLNLILTAAAFNMLLAERYVLCSRENGNNLVSVTPGFLFNEVQYGNFSETDNVFVYFQNRYEVELNTILNRIDSTFISNGSDESRISKFVAIHLTILYVLNKHKYIENVKLLNDVRQKLFSLAGDQSFYNHFKKEKKTENLVNLNFTDFDPNLEGDIDSPFSICSAQALICGADKNFLVSNKFNISEFEMDMRAVSHIRSGLDYYSFDIKSKAVPLSVYELFALTLALPTNSFVGVKDPKQSEYIISDGYNLSDASPEALIKLEEHVRDSDDITCYLKHSKVSKGLLSTVLIPIKCYDSTDVTFKIDNSEYEEVYDWKWQSEFDVSTNLYELQHFICKMRKRILKSASSSFVTVIISSSSSFKDAKITLYSSNTVDLDVVLLASNPKTRKDEFVRFKKNPFKSVSNNENNKILSLI